jgi:hypothetical protein
MIAAAAIAAGGTAYAANEQSKAAETAAGAMRNYKDYDPYLLDSRLNAQQILGQGLATNDALRPWAQNNARKNNAFNLKEAIRAYQKLQPYFRGIQDQVGKNTLSYARGELPADVQSQIGRAAAERGIQGGFGFGSQGARSGALANLNLRNLGLTSLDLSKFGTSLGMQVNQNAKSLAPNLMSGQDFLFNPQQWLGIAGTNIGIEGTNAQYINQARLANASAGNAVAQNVADRQYAAALGQAQTAQAGANQIAGLLSNYYANQSRQPATASTGGDAITGTSGLA